MVSTSAACGQARRSLRGLDIRDGVGTTGDSLLAGSAVPDTSGVTLDGNLSAEGACVTGVLGDFHLLDLLTERGTVTVDFALVFRRPVRESSQRSGNFCRGCAWCCVRTGYRIYR